ncbi:hypothetical protein [Winogradskya consettensis]|uniref:hypothetical protein n=1 Tax=Winogradskya consettensis TaxID=113560 RepID=UPI001BB3086F|nr:hypothetical protein [Actinoplanes consettensis]
MLAAYPWQRLNYRFGRWQAEQTLWKGFVTFGAWETYHWESTVESFQLLDPYTGAKLGEMYSQKRLQFFKGSAYAEPDVLTPPAGAVEVAGDPRSIAAYRPAGGAADTIRISWDPYLNNVVLREGIQALRTGQSDTLPPAYLFVDLDLLDKYRAWFVDEPDKPARKAPWANDVRTYRPGGPPRFGRSR